MNNPDADRLPETGDGVVFYGSLMRGLGALDALPSRDALRYVGPCQIHGELYDLGPYPGVCNTDQHGMKDGAPGPTRIVQAELHAILDPRVVEELDHFEGYNPEQPANSLYLRTRVPLLASTDLSDLSQRSRRPEDENETWAWVYIYNHTPDPAQRVDSGDWRAHTLMRARPDSRDESADESTTKEQPS